jgi:hypothetical protein
MLKIQQAAIERAYELLQTYGPAAAYDYMQEAGGIINFPLAILTAVRRAVDTQYCRYTCRSRTRVSVPRPEGRRASDRELFHRNDSG